MAKDNPKPAVTVAQPTLMPTNKHMAYTAGAVLSAVLLSLIADYTSLSFAQDPRVMSGLPIVGGWLMGYFVQDLPNT